MELPPLEVLTAPLKLWVQYKSPHNALACPPHDALFTSGPSELPTGWRVWGLVVRSWVWTGQNLLCADQAEGLALSQPFSLPTGPPGPPQLAEVWCPHRLPQQLQLSPKKSRGQAGICEVLLRDKPASPTYSPSLWAPHRLHIVKVIILQNEETRAQILKLHLPCMSTGKGWCFSQPWFPHPTPRVGSRINEMK